MSQLHSVVLHKIPTWQKLAAPYEMCGRCNAMHAYIDGRARDHARACTITEI